MSIIKQRSDKICLSIARLGLELDAQGADLDINLPHSYKKFIQPVGKPQALLRLEKKRGDRPFYNDQMILHVKNEPFIETKRSERAPLYHSENWEAWIDKDENFILEALRLPPARRIIVSSNFSRGEMQGDFSISKNDGVYPLFDLDIKLFANWLAGFSDVILHASGMIADGRGYAFVGSAGAGKSTLAASLAASHSFTVLGEDQVILRYLEGQFWIFGTPWHENPEMCSSLGIPLEKLFFLDQNLSFGVQSIQPVEGVTRILQTAFIPYYRKDLLPGILDRLKQLSEQVPFYSLNYQLGTDPWQIIN